MFLATTALSDYWDRSQKILFLGEWCKSYSKKQIWQDLSYETLPYHWDDRVKLFKDYLYLDKVYEKYLEILTDKLNNIHQVDHSIKYWRIIIGPWLKYFCEIIFDRYLSIKSARESNKIQNTYLRLYSYESYIPYDFNNFLRGINTDEFNFFIYCKLIELMKPFNCSYLNSNNEESNKTNIQTEKKSRIKNNIVRLINYSSKLIPSNINKVFIEPSYFKRYDLIKLNLSLRQIPNFILPIYKNYETQISTKKRQDLKIGYRVDEFTEVLNILIPNLFPIDYLEEYNSFAIEANKKYPQNPQIVITLNAYSSNEVFKFWVASLIEKGSKMYIGQHGGHYGTGLFSSTEKHEIDISNKYLSWGWTRSEKVVSLSRNIFKKPFNSRNICRNKIVYLNLNIASRYSYRLYSVPIGPQWEYYILSIIELLKNIDSKKRKDLICRNYILDYGWDIQKRIQDEISINFASPNLKWKEEMQKAKLVIETCNLTSFLESISLNIPTILYLDPRYWELNKEAEFFFGELKKVKIYHENLVSASKFINLIFNEPSEWWYSNEIQRVKNNFCEKYSRLSANWVDDWKSFIKKEL